MCEERWNRLLVSRRLLSIRTLLVRHKRILKSLAKKSPILGRIVTERDNLYAQRNSLLSELQPTVAQRDNVRSERDSLHKELNAARLRMGAEADQFVSNLYRAILRREPDQNEVLHW